MFRLQGKITFSFLALKVTCVILLAALAMISLGCTHTKPQSVAKPLTSKVKKSPRQLPDSEEYEDDYSTGYHGTSLLRSNLSLAGTNWEWEGELNAEGFKGMDNASAFSLEFKPDGWFDFHADCRQGTGMFEVKGEHIALAVIKSTHSGCHRDSQANDFQRALEAARTFRLDDSKLFFDIGHEGRAMVFHLKP